MKRMRPGIRFTCALRHAILVVLFASLVLVLGCHQLDNLTNVVNPPPPARQRTTIVVALLDLSRSTVAKATRARYGADLPLVANRLFYGDELSVWSIDADSIKNSRPLNNDAEWPIMPYNASSTYETRRLIAQYRIDHPLAKIRADSLAPVLAHLGDVTEGSDILGAMNIASRKLTLNPNAERWLIVYSDMLISDEHFDMLKKSVDPVQMLAEVRKTDGIPKLTNVNVVVVGANAKDKTQYRNVQDFWLRYFQAAGAKMPPAAYGTELPSELLQAINPGINFDTADPRRVQ